MITTRIYQRRCDIFNYPPSAMIAAGLVHAIPLQIVKAQNSTTSNANGGTAAKTSITTTGNKTVIIIPAKSSSTTAPSYNRTGFTNLYVLTINGKAFPIKYSITGGKLVGILADKDRSTLVLVLNRLQHRMLLQGRGPRV